MTATLQTDSNGARASVLAVLAKVSTAELKAAKDGHWPDVEYRELKPAEIGLVMLRGRIGGDGAPFNVGEATVSRAIIEMPNGLRGFGQCLGRDIEKAKLAAIFDALWQQEPERVERILLDPARAKLNELRQTTASQTAATKVDFFTLVRGED